MKKILITLIFAGVAMGISAQRYLSTGLKTGYMTNYSNMQYGFDLAYQMGPSLEFAFTTGFNSNFSKKLTNEDTGNVYNTEYLNFNSYNLDVRFYLLQFETFATGPALGGQLISVKYKNIVDSSIDKFTVPGFNIGWHARFYVTDEFQINGGWRWTNAKETMKYAEGKYDRGYHFFYLGAAWTFDLR